MKKILYLLTVIIFVLGSCAKQHSKEDIKTEEKQRFITLREAIKIEKYTNVFKDINTQSHLPINKMDYVNNNSLDFSTRSAMYSQTPTSCLAYPQIMEFRNSVSVYSTGDNVFPGGNTALKHKFQKGRTYVIKFSMSMVNEYGHNNVTMISKFPSLQIGLANESNFPTSCGNLIDLANLNIPFHNVQKIPGQNRNMNSNASFTINSYSRSITFVADECYEYLWLNAIPTPGTYSCSIGVSNIDIIESENPFLLSKTGEFDNGGLVNFKVTYNGFVIDHPFAWETTGDLAIIGSNNGNTVTVKSTNQKPIKGKVIASIPGCGIFAEEAFDLCSGDVFVNGNIYGPTFLYTHYHSNNDQEFTLALNPGETFTMMHIVSDRSQVEFWRSGNTFKLRIPPNWVFAKSPYQDHFTITLKGIDSNGCQKHISKGITVYPAPGTGDPNGPQVPDY